MKQTKVLRVLNPDFFAVPTTIGLFQRAFQNGDVEHPAVALMKMPNWAGSPGVYIAVGWEEGEPKGLVIGLLPSETTFKEPLLYMLHNEGPVRLRRALVTAVLDWVKDVGYNSLLTVEWNAPAPEEDGQVCQVYRDALAVETVAPLYRLWIGD